MQKMYNVPYFKGVYKFVRVGDWDASVKQEKMIMCKACLQLRNTQLLNAKCIQ